MATDCLFREDSYLKDCGATVVAIEPNGGIVLDRTVFYAASGGQPADRGTLVSKAGATIPIANVGFTDSGKTTIAHVPAPNAPPVAVGDTVSAEIDWPVRYARMRMHTALHLLSAVLPYPVTGGSVGEAESRLDFDIPDAGLDKDEITAEARRIGTYGISIIPDQDCCTLFTPRHPATRARLGAVEQAERALAIEDMVASAVAATVVEDFRFPMLKSTAARSVTAQGESA